MAPIRASLPAGAIALILLVSCAPSGPPSPPPAAQVSTAFDGTYEGNSVVVKEKSWGDCIIGGQTTLKVANGHATTGVPGDTREGWVAPDGSLKMTGTSHGGPATLEGKFEDDTFTGVSVLGSPPHCVFNWPGFKRV
jgi:hypothetical protein